MQQACSQERLQDAHLIGVTSACSKEIILWHSEAQENALTSIVQLHTVHWQSICSRDDLLVRAILGNGLGDLFSGLLLL